MIPVSPISASAGNPLAVSRESLQRTYAELQRTNQRIASGDFSATTIAEASAATAAAKASISTVRVADEIVGSFFDERA